MTPDARLHTQYFTAGVSSRARAASPRIARGEIVGAGEPHHEGGRGFDIEGEIREHRPHHRLVDEMPLEHAAVARVMDRLRQRHAHDAGRRKGAIEPRELHHVDDGAHAPALLAHAPSKGIVELDLGGGVGAVAELVLEALEVQRVDRAVRTKARHEKAGEPARRLRQHQERVAHGRRHEPFVAGDAVAFTRGLRARGVAAHVGAALLLGHSHAERDADLLPPGAGNGGRTGAT